MILNGFVHSHILEKDTGISIITPHNLYSEEKYKVAYMLHGLGGEQTTWPYFSMLPTYALDGNTIYVCPNVERSFYTDMKYGFKFFTYITEDLPKICKSVFNISAKREDTSIIGVSMGGYGALKCALAHPELYANCGAISSACLYMKDGLADQRNPETYKKMVELYGESILQDMVYIFGEKLQCDDIDDLTTQAKKLAQSGKERPNFFATCGTEDPYNKQNNTFKEYMSGIGYSYKYEEWHGTHELPFFDQSLKKIIAEFGL